jgi:hypothetical protein
MKRNILAIIMVFGLIGWSCSKMNTQPGQLGLKQSIEKNTADINTALSRIAGTKGYQLLSLNDITAKSEIVFNDSITLALIAGIYDYQPDTMHLFYPMFPHRLFKKTGTSDKMIVNLPEKLIFHPKYLHNFNLTDSVLKNNFTISASDYHLYYTFWNSYDYRLTADFTLNSADIGSLDVEASANSNNGRTYSSKYTFTEGYNVSTESKTGDTSTSSIALLKDTNVLLKETNVFIGTDDDHHGAKQYILTIGNVEIKRITGVDSIQVYLDGVLQKHAAAIITDSTATATDTESEGSIFHKRDIMLTFNDGTTAKLSELIGPALTQLGTIINSLRDMYFAKYIVDYIAINIFYNSR